MFKTVSRYFPGVVLMAALPLGVAPAVYATPILEGHSDNSYFSILSCSGACTESSLAPDTVTLGTDASGGASSTLSLIDTGFSTSGNVIGLVLAAFELSVGQKPGDGQGSGDSGISFAYNLLLTFTTPSHSISHSFSTGISGNNLGGSNASVALSGLNLTMTDPLSLGAVTLSNFRFDTTGGDSSFSNGTWTVNGKDTVATLRLLTDVTATAGAATTTVQIPIPATGALMLLGLAGLGWSRRKAQNCDLISS